MRCSEMRLGTHGRRVAANLHHIQSYLGLKLTLIHLEGHGPTRLKHLVTLVKVFPQIDFLQGCAVWLAAALVLSRGGRRSRMRRRRPGFGLGADH